MILLHVNTHAFCGCLQDMLTELQREVEVSPLTGALLMDTVKREERNEKVGKDETKAA